MPAKSLICLWTESLESPVSNLVEERNAMASSADILVDHERQTWALIQQKDLEKFATYLAEDFYDIFPDGEERSKSELLEFLSNADLKEYKLTNFRVTMLNSEAAIVTYNLDARAVIQGKEISMRNAVTSGWAKRDGSWLNVSAVASARS
jgi:hypothetical protein